MGQALHHLPVAPTVNMEGGMTTPTSYNDVSSIHAHCWLASASARLPALDEAACALTYSKTAEGRGQGVCCMM